MGSIATLEEGMMDATVGWIAGSWPRPVGVQHSKVPPAARVPQHFPLLAFMNKHGLKSTPILRTSSWCRKQP